MKDKCRKRKSNKEWGKLLRGESVSDNKKLHNTLFLTKNIKTDMETQSKEDKEENPTISK